MLHLEIKFCGVFSHETCLFFNVIDYHEFALQIEVFGRNHLAEVVRQQLPSDVDSEARLLHRDAVEERDGTGGRET